LFEGSERFRDIPTSWSRLKGPPREALDYLYRVYGRAVLNYMGGRLSRGDFRPLRVDDRDDLFQDFFLRLGTTEWLSKPDPSRGRFRPYFVKRLILFLGERRTSAVRGHSVAPAASVDAAEPAVPDPLEIRLEQEWSLAVIGETMDRIRRKNVRHYDVLKAHLENEDAIATPAAAGLGLSLDAYKSLLKRARKEFKEVFDVVAARLDGFGGAHF